MKGLRNMSMLQEWGGDAVLADEAAKFNRRATKHSVDLGNAITRIINGRSSQSEKAEALLRKFSVFHRKLWTENLTDCTKATNRHTILVTALFYEVEKYITDDELFWGIWHLYHDKFLFWFMGDALFRQDAMYRRGDRLSRGALFIANAHKKFCNAASKIQWKGNDFEVFYMVEKASGSFRKSGAIAFDTNVGWLSRFDDEEEVECWRGFYVDKHQHWKSGDEFKTAQRWIRDSKKGKQDGSITAEMQNDGKGFAYTLDKNVAIYFAVSQTEEATQRGKQAGRRAVIARYKIKRKNIKACFFQEGEDEIVADNRDARLIDYKLDKTRTFTDKNISRALHAVNAKRIKAQTNQLATGALSVAGSFTKKMLKSFLKEQGQNQTIIKDRVKLNKAEKKRLKKLKTKQRKKNRR